MKTYPIILISFLLIFNLSFAQKDKKKDVNSKVSLAFRNIGPAFASGRVSDFSVNPNNSNEYYVGFAAGHIWKTSNNGTTYQPIFDNQGSYSIGCLKMDPKNTNVIWAGTGENNHQRSVSYGDGVYKSVDGGKSWENMGLKNSRQIGMIVIDPRNTDVVFVAAEGSVWGDSTDRGLYKTIDGGKNWIKVLNISKYTGVNNVVIDNENPDIMYATSEQRRRHVHIRIGGGPESSIWKSTDAGTTWRKLIKGLPSVDKGGIGIAISPLNHNYIYAMVEAAMKKGGFYRSTDQGESWEKMSDYHTSGQYYGEIVCSPTEINTIYAPETRSKISRDGGKTWTMLGSNKRHVDDHAIWINPKNPEHFMIGGDGGVYETYDHGKEYIHKTNLPVTQFYRVAVDNDYPFYNIYGGTQDNNSFGGPSQTLYANGITKGDWEVILGGDGYWQAIDPTEPNIVYTEYQYGNIFRFDKKSGERISVKPLPRKDEDTYKWNWNSPFILSKHNHKRLYMAANKVFKSDDRGDTWQVISEDITRQLSRDTWPVMDQYWSVDAVAKNVSTSLFGMGVSLAESSIKEGLVYVGTDDGVIQVTENATTWKKTTRFSDVPEYTYVSDIAPSKHDENIVYASFDNRKRDDFTPYILKSTDKGKSWKNISNNLPKNGTVHTIEQDHKNANLLFVGTEFGVFYSDNGGKEWNPLKNGLPTISVRDMIIQERENDLVLGTFGRGFYVLDDYTPLRHISGLNDKKAVILPIKDALLYTQKRDRGYGSGSMPYYGKNAPYGATFTYYLKDIPKTAQEQRRENEKELIKTKSRIPKPDPRALYKQNKEIKPYLLFTITDENGSEIRKITKNASSGVHRITWDLKYLWKYSIHPQNEINISNTNSYGIKVVPGTYFIKMDLIHNNSLENLVKNQKFVIKLLDNTTLPEQNKISLKGSYVQLAELGRITWGTNSSISELNKKLNSLYLTCLKTTNLPNGLTTKITDAIKQLEDIKWKMNGEQPRASYEEAIPAPMSLNKRLNKIIYLHNQSTSSISQKQKDGYLIIKESLKLVIKDLKIINTDILEVEKQLELAKAPWTSGRILEFKE